ncbi:hypothetical protein CRG98_003773 [Punica granatum]|uniref:Retrotransposon gag domain-containing protein n=1 Tax=Punica granatum TaxID=22663 RepID=A0A2I0L592_PUNGR|nr:hypothetical protein CRG98_003773 [Punica granatum]
MAEEQQPAIHEQDTPPMPTHSQTPLTQAILLPIPAEISTTHSGVPITHPPPPMAQTALNLVDSARFTVLEGMVNQLVTNMATNMTELMAMLRDQNQASSSFTLPSKHRPNLDPNPVVPPIYVTDSEDVSFSAMTYVPAVHPISDPLSLPPAPTTILLPPAAFLSTYSTMHALPPLAMPVHPPIYTVPSPTVPPDSLTRSVLDWFMTLKAGDIHTWTDLYQKFLDQYRFCVETPPTLLDLSMMEMRESQTFEAYATEWRGKAAKHISLITKRQQVQMFQSTLRGAYYLHLLAHTSSFLDLIEVGKKLDVGVKLGRIEGPSRKKDREALKRFLKHMHSSIQRNRLISRPCQMLFSRNLHNSTLPLRFSKVEPQLRDLLRRLNGLLLHKLNRVALLNPVNTSSIHLCQLLLLTYSGNSL